MRTFLQTNFNGEWSDYLLGRVELARYGTAVRRMVNFLPTIYGGARKRFGTKYLGELLPNAWLQDFRFSNEVTYLFEFDENIIRFWRDRALLTDTVVTPYSAEEATKLRYTSVNDLVYFAHVNHPPQQLSRITDDDWETEILAIENEPYEDQNSSEVSLTPSGISGNITLTSSADRWTTEHVGTRYEITHLDNQEAFESTQQRTRAGLLAFNASGGNYSVGDRVTFGGNHYTCSQDYSSGTDYVLGDDSPANYPSFFETGIIAIDAQGDLIDVEVFGPWTFRTEGAYTGEWQLRRSFDDGVTYSTLYSMSSTDGSDNYLREGDETGDPILLRLVLISGGNEDDLVTLTLNEVERSGYALITGIDSPTVANATVETELFSTASTRLWAENDWNPRKGYPSQVIFWQNRLIFAGTRREPQAVWASRKDGYTDFRRDENSTDDALAPFKDNLYSRTQASIRWLSAQQQLLVGLDDAMRNLVGVEESTLTPGNNQSQRQAGKGAADLQPIEIEDITFYTQNGGRIIRAATSNYERGVYVAQDMTSEAEHVTKGGVVQMAAQIKRDAYLHNVTGNGEIASLIYEPDIQKQGFCRLKTKSGLVKSIAVLPNNEEEDEVYIAVEREIEGVTKRYLEVFEIGQIRNVEESNKLDFWGLDSAVQYNGAETDTITGLNHLEGLEVSVWADGAVQESRTVTGGEITLQYAASKVLVGLPIEAELWMMPLEGLATSGSTSKNVKKIDEVFLDFYKTLGGSVGDSPDGKLSVLEFRGNTEVNDSPELFTGRKKVNINNKRDFSRSVYFKHDEPGPCFVRQLIVDWEATA